VGTTQTRESTLKLDSGFCLGCVVCVLGAENTFATTIVNGDFSTGDLTGWTASAIDAALSLLSPSPFIFVTNVGGNHVVEFKTGQFADGLFSATLEQTFPIIPTEPILSFDFSLPTVLADPTGTGISPFFDSFFVSLASGINSLDLLLEGLFRDTPNQSSQTELIVLIQPKVMPP
jgi:hypothetical protein